ncbi:phasin family protein [Acinetobacter sp. ANC 3813]|uniref:phasin family protein n=1 Tax=Acinetobacter sp. ANC 3813 TaxID=1977873 RepID=UPI000A357E44|nr:phasin family protein [Acinetobacter sp. ANC 3813]OTG91479.1 poly(hydroxyalcanoate) granule associated protein [Acinetobacter sp. ANC 3813]
MDKTNTNDSESIDQNVAEKHNKAKLRDSHNRKSVLDFRKYTKQIWLAGLGAFSRAEEEGNKLFDSLVKVGEELESKTIDIADQTVEKVSEKAKESVVETKDKVEKILDHGVNQSLNRIGLSGPKDIQRLEKLILQLNEKIDHLAEDQRKILEQLAKK